MARTLDPVAHAVRRDAFVDAAQRLIQAKGYEQLSIQEVLDEVGASKGAFYHYFDSKAALLEAVVERMVDARRPRSSRVARRPEPDGPREVRRLFSAASRRWKAERKDLLLARARLALGRQRDRPREVPPRRRRPG